VEHGDGSVVTSCVAFNGDSISGEELLNQSGVAWSSQTFGGFGDAVCAIDGEPSRYVDCPGKDSYWAVFVSRGGGPWQLASVGISSLTLGDGDAEGFRYVPEAGIPAAPLSASEACAATATPVPRRSAAAGTAAPRPTTGATPAILATPATGSPDVASPTATAPPVAAAVATATVAASPRPPAPNPAPTGGIDAGLLLAAGVGVVLAGLTILRLIVRRRPGP